MTTTFRWMSVWLVSVAMVWLTGRPAVAAPSIPAGAGVWSRYAVVVVVNDLPGSHVVTYNWQARKLDAPGDRAVLFLPLDTYVMLNLDGKPNAFYHLGYTQPGLKVLYTSWFRFGPL